MSSNFILVLFIIPGALAFGKHVEYESFILSDGGDDTKPWIVPGELVKPGEIPYQVQLLRGPTRRIQCSGTIIDKKWVIAAAHCMSSRKFRILAGTVNNRERGPNATIVDVEKIIVHPKYRAGENFIINDIALMKLERPLNFTKYVQSAKLPTVRKRYGARVLISGWGQTKNESYPKLLHKMVLKLVEDKECQEAYKSKGYLVDKTHICAGDKERTKSVCYGDAGGPWLDIEKKVLVGIVSWIPDKCKAELPNVGTEISHYVKWIKGTIQDN